MQSRVRYGETFLVRQLPPSKRRNDGTPNREPADAQDDRPAGSDFNVDVNEVRTVLERISVMERSGM